MLFSEQILYPNLKAVAQLDLNKILERIMKKAHLAISTVLSLCLCTACSKSEKPDQIETNTTQTEQKVETAQQAQNFDINQLAQTSFLIFHFLKGMLKMAHPYRITNNFILQFNKTITRLKENSIKFHYLKLQTIFQNTF